MSRFSKAGVAGDSDLKKQLKIKSGTLKRCVDSSSRGFFFRLAVMCVCSISVHQHISVAPLARASLSAELKMYTTEKQQVEAKLEKLTAAESDAHDRKKAVR